MIGPRMLVLVLLLGPVACSADVEETGETADVEAEETEFEITTDTQTVRLPT